MQQLTDDRTATVTRGDLTAPTARAKPRVAGRRRSAARAGTSSLLLRVVSVGILLGLWELAGAIPVSIAFPRFSATAGAFVEMLADGTFLAAYSQTILPLLVGVPLTALGGVLAGTVMGLAPKAQWLGLPVFIILQTAPSAAIVPLITFVYGIGFTAKVLAVVLLSAPVIVINSYRSLAEYPSMFAAILSIIIFASVTVTLLQRVEQRLFRPEMRAA